MKRLSKITAAYDTDLSKEALEQKLNEALEAQALPENLPQKSRQYFYWRKKGDGYELSFYHCFRSDMCDTAFYGEIKSGLKGSRLEGIIKKPAGVWAVFWIIIAAAIALFLAFFVYLMLNENSNPDFIPIFIFLISVPTAFIEISMLMFDKKRLEALNSYLRSFTEAVGEDPISDELENEKHRL